MLKICFYSLIKEANRLHLDVFVVTGHRSCCHTGCHIRCINAGMIDSKFRLILMSINAFSFFTIDIVFTISAITFIKLLIINRSGYFTRALNENIAQNHFNIALLSVF